MKLHEYLTNLKDQRGMTLQEISNLSGVPYNTVRRVLTGETQRPGVDTAKYLITTLGGDLRMLPKLGLVDDLPPEAPAAAENHAVAENHCPLDRIQPELLMAYRSSMLRLSRQNRYLRALLLGVCALLFLLMAAVIALFAYDYSHLDRGWIQSFLRSAKRPA